MRQREQNRESGEQQQPQPAGGTPSGTGEGLSELRAAGSSLLAEGSAIIDAALSGNSQSLLNAARQMGGQ